MPALTPRARLLVVPRRGFTADECEDAGSIGTGRFAVSDGASESAHSGIWARLFHLVAGIGRHLCAGWRSKRQ